MVLPPVSRPLLPRPQDQPWTRKTGRLPLPQVQVMVGGLQDKNCYFLKPENFNFELVVSSLVS